MPDEITEKFGAMFLERLKVEEWLRRINSSHDDSFAPIIIPEVIDKGPSPLAEEYKKYIMRTIGENEFRQEYLGEFVEPPVVTKYKNTSGRRSY